MYPNSAIDILITSPFFKNFPSTTPTPPGVPVKTKSPGSRVNAVERCSTKSKQLKIKFLVLEDCLCSPLTSVIKSRLCGSLISSGVTMAGPKGQCVSNDLPIVKVGTHNCQSLTLKSFAMV